MSTKIKGEAIKEGSIPLSALSSDMNIPAYIDFVKTLSDEDINTTLSIPYTKKVVLISRNDTRILNSGESTIYSNYGMTFTFTALMNASTLELHIDGRGSLNVFGIKVYKDINKIKKEFLPDDIGGADWNAQEGEAGYIKNKPFRKIKSINTEITNINSLFVITEDAFYPTCDLMIKYNNKTALLAKEKQEIYWGDGTTAETDDTIFFLGDDGESNIIVTNENGFDFELIIPLSSDFISDTVVKTTPQTLSTTDKNQALANLGVDPVVLKYMMNPHIVEYESTSGSCYNAIPKELSDIIYQNGEFNHLVLSTILIKIVSDADETAEWIVERIKSYRKDGTISFNDTILAYDTETRLFIV